MTPTSEIDIKNNQAYQSGFQDALEGHSYQQYIRAFRKDDSDCYTRGYVDGLNELKKRQANSTGERQ